MGILAALGIMGAGWFLPPSASALSFFKELVSEEAVPNSELKIDSQGNLHAVFLTKGTGEIKYAAKMQNGWAMETLGAGINAQWVSLALDEQDYVHIAFYDPVGQVKYAHKTSGVWNIVTIASAYNSQCRIAVYGLERVYIAYNSGADGTNLGRMYLALIDPVNGVNIEEIDPGGDAGYGPSLALDKGGRPHLTYFDRKLERLKYAFKINGSWQISLVDSAPLTGWQSALALDSRGRPYIAYYDFLGADLKYAYKNYPGWALEVVDDMGQVGQYPVLAFDSRGRLLLAYYDASGGDLKIAYRSNTGWVKVAIDQTGDVGQHISLGVNVWGEGCLLYYDYDSTTNTTRLYYGLLNLPRIYLSSPRVREVWQAGSQHTISWQTKSSEILSFKIQYAASKFIWITIADNLPSGQRDYQWIVPRQRGLRNCRIRILGKGVGGKILATELSPYFLLKP